MQAQKRKVKTKLDRRTISFYPTEETIKLLENVAEREHRSVSSQIDYIVEQWIKNFEKKFEEVK